METLWTTRVYALLPHSIRPAVLCISTERGLALPSILLSERLDTARVEQVWSELGPACGLPVNILRCLGYAEVLQEHHAEALYLLEDRADADGAGRSAAHWVDLRELDHRDLLPESLRQDFVQWLDERESDGSGISLTDLKYAQWASPGWYAQVEDWIRVQLDKNGKTFLSAAPMKSWGISVVLRVSTNNRNIYFKASRDLPLFVNEGVVMSALARMFPENIPAPLAVEPVRNWMLLEDFGSPLGRRATLEQQAQMFQAMAHLQMSSSGQIDRLLRVGCIDRRIPWLQARLSELLEDGISLSPLTQAEREALVLGMPRLRDLLAELDGLPIPPALIHGDLHAGNVAVLDGRILFFDWTDAAISHPFFDLFDIFSVKDPAQRETLETTYRSVWLREYQEKTVCRAMALARVVYGLYHAVSYSVIVNNLTGRERDDLNGAHFFFRRVLEGLTGATS